MYYIQRLDDDADEDDTEFLCRNELEKDDARVLDEHVFMQSPLPHRPSRAPSSSPPTWLMSSAEIKKNPAQIVFSTLGIHLMNHGHDVSCCCLTIREIDSELKHSKHNASDILMKHHDDKNKALAIIHSFAKRGIIGRLLTGIRIKMLQVSSYYFILTYILFLMLLIDVIRMHVMMELPWWRVTLMMGQQV